MSNFNVKIIYSLKVHLKLQSMGFEYLSEMKNPRFPQYNCWVYENTESLKLALGSLNLGDRNER